MSAQLNKTALGELKKGRFGYARICSRKLAYFWRGAPCRRLALQFLKRAGCSVRYAFLRLFTPFYASLGWAGRGVEAPNPKHQAPAFAKATAGKPEKLQTPSSKRRCRRDGVRKAAEDCRTPRRWRVVCRQLRGRRYRSNSAAGDVPSERLYFAPIGEIRVFPESVFICVNPWSNLSVSAVSGRCANFFAICGRVFHNEP